MADERKDGALPQPSRMKRAWTVLAGRPLETASAADLDRAGIGARPMRKETEEANAVHIKELRRRLRWQRFMRALPLAVTLVLLAGIGVYLLLTRS